MEETKKTNLSNGTKQNTDDGLGMPGCPFWFFGDENSADNDLKKKFEVVDEKEN